MASRIRWRLMAPTLAVCALVGCSHDAAATVRAAPPTATPTRPGAEADSSIPTIAASASTAGHDDSGVSTLTSRPPEPGPGPSPSVTIPADGTTNPPAEALAVLDTEPGDATDPAARVRAAARATAGEQWLALTVRTAYPEQATIIYENGVAGCLSMPPFASHSGLSALLQSLGTIRDATVSSDGTYDPKGEVSAGSLFYDVRLDEEGRLSQASWYAGEVATFYTFAYDVDRAPAPSCPGTTNPSG